MLFDSIDTDLISSDMKTWPLSDQKLGAGDVTLFLGSDGTGGNTFHGFVKDMVSIRTAVYIVVSSIVSPQFLPSFNSPFILLLSSP